MGIPQTLRQKNHQPKIEELRMWFHRPGTVPHIFVRKHFTLYEHIKEQLLYDLPTVIT